MKIRPVNPPRGQLEEIGAVPQQTLAQRWINQEQPGSTTAWLMQHPPGAPMAKDAKSSILPSPSSSRYYTSIESQQSSDVQASLFIERTPPPALPWWSLTTVLRFSRDFQQVRVDHWRRCSGVGLAWWRARGSPVSPDSNIRDLLLLKLTVTSATLTMERRLPGLYGISDLLAPPAPLSYRPCSIFFVLRGY